MECMSSEESADEDEDTLYVRCPPWRSARLQNFYDSVDEMGKALAGTKRGTIRKTRLRGPPKDGLVLPPKGTASWMVSKNWVMRTQREHPSLPILLNGLVVDEPVPESEHLGESSDDERYIG